MGNSTKTLLRFAQLLETEPPILPPTARESVQQLAKELASLAETDTEEAAAKIIAWMQQFPQELTTFEKALAKQARKQVDEIEEPDPQEMQYTIPNFQIIESVEETVTKVMLIAPGSSAPQKISLLLFVSQLLPIWMQKNQ
ncbi:hypothetical protein [[Phormidium] sp. ETS-05]|uniref:hypothetical protein n=1 Tax=[Phormidium] sp. ETS-05 TaxID=222819 RepID=UPI0018EEF420|nr:hypothetical protein [[Phormidium] sp. ETS-05]